MPGSPGINITEPRVNNTTLNRTLVAPNLAHNIVRGTYPSGATGVDVQVNGAATFSAIMYPTDWEADICAFGLGNNVTITATETSTQQTVSRTGITLLNPIHSYLAGVKLGAAVDRSDGDNSEEKPKG